MQGRERHIVALGGFDGDERIRDYLLELTGVQRPSVCFLPTATGDLDLSIALFHEQFPASRCDSWPLRLFGTPERPGERLLEADAVIVSGGNTANMLALWRVDGVDAALREAWERGIVLAGWSAGAICWFESGVTDSFGPQLAPIRDCLALIAGSFCPHYDGEALRRPTYRRLVADGTLPAGYAADDDVALRFGGTELAEVVSAREGATAYAVEPDGGGVRETPLATRVL